MLKNYNNWKKQPNKKNNFEVSNKNEPETTVLKIQHYQFTNKCPETTINLIWLIILVKYIFEQEFQI